MFKSIYSQNLLSRTGKFFLMFPAMSIVAKLSPNIIVSLQNRICKIQHRKLVETTTSIQQNRETF